MSASKYRGQQRNVKRALNKWMKCISFNWAIEVGCKSNWRPATHLIKQPWTEKNLNEIVDYEQFLELERLPVLHEFRADHLKQEHQLANSLACGWQSTDISKCLTFTKYANPTQIRNVGRGLLIKGQSFTLGSVTTWMYYIIVSEVYCRSW